MKALLIGVLSLVVCGEASVAQSKPNLSELAAATNVASCAVSGGDSNAQNECEKRDAARLFIGAGHPEVALRILCNTRVVTESFRLRGAGDLKYDDFVSANHECLQAIGLDVKK